MAACFTEWTVLPHDPIERHSSNLWSVSGKAPGGAQRRMTVAKLGDGRLIVHNAIALEDPDMAALDAFGEVAAILVPNGFHRQDARIWKDRYPKARVYCPKKATRKVGKIVPVDGDYSEAPGDATVRVQHLEGVGGAEGFMHVKSDGGSTLVFNDMVLNMPPTRGISGWMIAPTGRPGIPRFMRFVMLKDKRALGTQLSALSEEPTLERIICGHGDSIVSEPGNVLGALVSEFCS